MRVRGRTSKRFAKRHQGQGSPPSSSSFEELVDPCSSVSSPGLLSVVYSRGLYAVPAALFEHARNRNTDLFRKRRLLANEAVRCNDKMKRTMERSENGFLFRGSVLAIVISTLLGSAYSIQSASSATKRLEIRGTPMHMAQMTQKGYIQFLRWQLPVPRITEFTFCLWIQSNDLALAHSIFSYSLNERERLVRSWISAGGKSVHLEIGGKQVVASTTDIREDRWYHLCLSWENQAGLYGLWINGQLWARGQSEETVGHVIPSGGDIVLGQEYTDFDKGLEEGIEGSVLGFNLLLASAFDPLARDPRPPSPLSPSYTNVPIFARIPQKATQRVFFQSIPKEPRGRRYAERFESSPSNHTVEPRKIETWLGTSDVSSKDPIGLQLVQLSYVRCEIGRGSPYIGGPLMLISWSRTPVRVFGGAILKNAGAKCGNF